MLTISAASFADRPPPARSWLVEGMIAAGCVALLSGEGGIGKSALALLLGLSVASGSTWLGRPVKAGPVIGLFAEDDADELGRRLIRIAAGEAINLGDAGSFHLVSSGALSDGATLAVVSEGKVSPTALFDRLSKLVAEIKPSLVVLDPAAELAAIDENKRSEVAAFVRLLGGLAARSGAAILLLSHPSLTGIASGSGMSGSTAWHNSVRSRLVLTAPDANDPDRRRLVVAKSNYGPSGSRIEMRMTDGRFVAQAGAGSVEAREAEARIEAIFLSLLRRFTVEGRPVSASPSATYAPTVFAGEPEAKGLEAKALANAMRRLFVAKRIKIVEEGSQSRRRKRLAEATTNETTDPPADALPTPTNGVCAHTPHTPLDVGRPPPGVGSPGGQTNTEEQEEARDAWWQQEEPDLLPDDWRTDAGLSGAIL